MNHIISIQCIVNRDGEKTGESELLGGLVLSGNTLILEKAIGPK